MKNLLLLLIASVVLVHTSFGQNYSCISPSASKTYFLNAYNKLNGLRIDSVKSENGNTTYYPFKTMRCSVDGSNMDLSGANWLGAGILETSDHNSYIQTKWNDTFLIKNGALPGDSWVVYNDSTDIYFVGTVTAIDTMTVANMIDSVKTITINVMQGGSVLTSDALNGFQFAISKYNGLVKALPFYFFPFYNHQTNAPDFSYDYYISQSGDQNNVKNTFTFDKVDYQLSVENIFNFDIGDVFMSKSLEGPSFDDFYSTEIDTVTDKQINGGAVNYILQYYNQYVSFDETQHTLVYSNQSGSKTVSYPFDDYLYNSQLIDTSKMPEEIGNGYIEHYDPNDTSYFCLTSPLYRYDGISIAFEPTFSYKIFKNGIGLVHDFYNSFSAQMASDFYLTRMIKNGSMCGSNGLVGIQSVIQPSQLKIYPNPATDFIKVEISERGSNNMVVSLLNVMGTPVGQWDMKTNSLLIPTQGLTRGMYFLKFSDGTGSLVRKISIEK